MPIPKVSDIAKGNEDHFNYMRNIKAQCDRAVLFMPNKNTAPFLSTKCNALPISALQNVVYTVQ
jgi:hypothetical protein